MSEEITEETTGEIDEEKEFIKTILQRTSEESFITSNYLLIEENALNFSFDDISEEDFVKILTDMKETIAKVQEGYESAYMNLDRWTLEIATGDRMFREGLKEWDEGLDDLFEYCNSLDEEELNRGIKKIYEGNKKLIINQKIEEYVDEQVNLIQKEGGNFASVQGEKEISSSVHTEKPVITGNVIPVTGHMPLIPPKEQKTISDKTPEVKISSENPIAEQKISSEKIPDVKISAENLIAEQKISSEKIPDVKISVENPIAEQKISSDKIPEVKISAENLIAEQKISSDKIPEVKISGADIDGKEECTAGSHISGTETSRPAIPEEVETSEKEEHVAEISGETEDEKPVKKSIRKPAGLSKRVRKSSHGESSDISSCDEKEKKSIRRPAGLSRKAGKKKEE
ncbi:MAG: hypothetical protein ABRQ39_05815 [Candidatus Eremiobacterota bacterium]